MVTRDGRLYMFGKDTTYCDPTSGLVRDLQDVSVASVALRKAQAVALTTAGHIYTFGINNKGQCGRDLTSLSSASGAQAAGEIYFFNSHVTHAPVQSNNIFLCLQQVLMLQCMTSKLNTKKRSSTAVLTR